MSMIGLGRLELALLLDVARMGDDAYGAAIRRALNDELNASYTIGTVHVTLERLQEKGLVRSRMTDPLPIRGGRSRRVFSVTSAGRKALDRAREDASRLLDLLPDGAGG